MILGYGNRSIGSNPYEIRMQYICRTYSLSQKSVPADDTEIANVKHMIERYHETNDPDLKSVIETVISSHTEKRTYSPTSILVHKQSMTPQKRVLDVYI